MIDFDQIRQEGYASYIPNINSLDLGRIDPMFEEKNGLNENNNDNAEIIIDKKKYEDWLYCKFEVGFPPPVGNREQFPSAKHDEFESGVLVQLKVERNILYGYMVYSENNEYGHVDLERYVFLYPLYFFVLTHEYDIIL